MVERGRPGYPGYDPHGEERARFNRHRGHQDRQFNPKNGEDTDRQATAFEHFVCESLGIPREYWPGNASLRRGGCVTVEIGGLPTSIKAYHIHHPKGHLVILHPSQDPACGGTPANVYVVGKGQIGRGFTILGWTPTDVLIRSEPMPVGTHGFYKAMEVGALQPLRTLLTQMRPPPAQLDLL